MADLISVNNGQWHIRLFGDGSVQKPSGEIINFNGRKVGELLAYLALNPYQPHSRTKITSTLWADSDVGNERTRLRQEIAALRLLFADVDGSIPLVHITHNELRLDDRITIDCTRFMEIYTKAKQELDTKAKVLLLQESLSLYSADLLPDYDPSWIVSERNRYIQLRERVMLDLAAAQHLLRNFSAEEETLLKILTHNQLCEESHIALMQLYSLLGQSKRVEKQYKDLERVLFDAYGAPPSGDIRLLAASLGEKATIQAAAQTELSAQLSKTEISPSATEIHVRTSEASSVREHAESPSVPQSNQTPLKLRSFPRLFWLMPAVLLISCFATAMLWMTTRSHHVPPRIVSTVKPFQPRWSFLYTSRSGEKTNSQGNSIASDATGIYVTGLIQTDRDDVDILTLKLSQEGKLIWADRYSSPEHDCDRAYSLCLGEGGSLYVLGETFVPKSVGVAEGWYLTLLKYSTDGRREWVQRSHNRVKNDSHRMQVISDGQSGCYLAGTELLNGKQNIIAMHYSSSGRMLWQKSLKEGAETKFSRFAANRDGTLFLCGSARHIDQNDIADDDGFVISLESTGKEMWRKSIRGPVTGSDSSDNLILDRGENVYVSGVFDTGSTAEGGKGKQLGIDKFSSNGSHLWHRLARDTGPYVTQCGLSCNQLGDVAMGGTENYTDGSLGAAIVWYDANGDQTRNSHYPLSLGMRSAELISLNLERDGSCIFIGQISQSLIHEESSLLIVKNAIDGSPKKESLYNIAPGRPNYAKDFCTYGEKYFVTGQAGINSTENTLLVNSY